MKKKVSCSGKEAPDFWLSTGQLYQIGPTDDLVTVFGKLTIAEGFLHECPVDKRWT